MSTRRERAKMSTTQLNKLKKMGLIILFGLVTVAGVLYYLYDMHNQKKIEREY